MRFRKTLVLKRFIAKSNSNFCTLYYIFLKFIENMHNDVIVLMITSIKHTIYLIFQNTLFFQTKVGIHVLNKHFFEETNLRLEGIKPTLKLVGKIQVE